MELVHLGSLRGDVMVLLDRLLSWACSYSLDRLWLCSWPIGLTALSRASSWRSGSNSPVATERVYGCSALVHGTTGYWPPTHPNSANFFAGYLSVFVVGYCEQTGTQWKSDAVLIRDSPFLQKWRGWGRLHALSQNGSIFFLYSCPLFFFFLPWAWFHCMLSC